MRGLLGQARLLTLRAACRIAAAPCHRLDGIPLAIELTAVRLRALPLEHLAAQLTDSFALLDGGWMAALPRHQTLRTTIGWSHELCSPAERLLRARLRSSPVTSISPRWRPCAPTPSHPRAPRWAR
ncbi:hypothetical protein OG453_39545 [Streptomyces sp. NBC_01381]|uniref:hypothetical protein n=1 Tax=Streptomyces sp. NBC_01381 TaxID=2903845 RepID=UPI00225BC73E|nr:hypothetical protein [Streptomyces sp. NBC_01381]MCX4672672.1 hypothetical protein [Streptomyces sp. NBC_01381]